MVILENVAGLLSSEGGQAMGTILGALSDLGYGVAYRVLDAQHFGVPQRRRRVFLVGHLGDDRAGEVLALTESGSGDSPESGEARQEAPADAQGSAGGEDGSVTERTVGALCARDFKGVGSQYVSEGKLVTAGDLPEGTMPVAYGIRTANTSSNGWGVEAEKTHTLDRAANGIAVAVSENQRAEVLETETMGALKTSGGKPGQGYASARVGSAVRRLTPTQCERLMSWPDGWTKYGMLPDGTVKELADSPGYKMAGNGVVSVVVTAIAERIPRKMEPMLNLETLTQDDLRDLATKVGERTNLTPIETAAVALAEDGLEQAMIVAQAAEDATKDAFHAQVIEILNAVWENDPPMPNDCHECGRSFCPTYTDPCEH